MTEAVYGVRETIKTLQTLDNEAKKATIREMKAAAQPLARAIEGYIPSSPPLSGFDHGGRTGWRNVKRKVGVKYGGRKRKGRDEWPLLSLRIDSAPGVLYDMAGRGSTNRLGTALSREHGGASRAAWRPEKQLLATAQKAVEVALEEASKRLNEKLIKKPGGAR